LVPLLLRGGLAAAWCGLGAASLALTAAAWRGWPEGTADAAPAAPARGAPAGRPLTALYFEYALGAVGLVPHMVFFVDFVVRGLGRGFEAGAWYWVLFGMGAALGPVLAGRLADRLGFRTALRLAFLTQAAAVSLLLVASDAVALAVSSVTVGAIVPGIVPLVLGRVHELLAHGAARQAAWSRATTAFALGQAGAAYLFSFLFARGGGYGPLFALGAGALLLALLIDVAANAEPSNARSDR
jgi:predicted MFS family arabinose efflux permease